MVRTSMGIVSTEYIAINVMTLDMGRQSNTSYYDKFPVTSKIACQLMRVFVSVII